MKKTDPKWKKIEKFAATIPDEMKKKLDGESVKKKSGPKLEDGWHPLNDRKWELRHNELVLGTIFHKPDGKFSLWFKTPVIFKKTGIITSKTHVCDTFEESQNRFAELLKEHAEAWCKATLDYLNDNR